MNVTKHVVIAFNLSGEPGRRKLNGIFRYITERHLTWRIQLVRIPADYSRSFVRSFPERGIDGIIYSIYAPHDVAAELARITIPTVAVDCFDDALLQGRKRNLVYISGSPEDVGKSAARHLLSQGIYRSYAFVPDLYQHPWSKLRGGAFFQELKDNGIPVRYETRVIYGTNEGTGMADIEYYKEHNPEPALAIVPDIIFPGAFAEKGYTAGYIHSGMILENIVEFTGGQALNQIAGKAEATVRFTGELVSTEAVIAEQAEAGLWKLTAFGKSKHSCLSTA